MYRPRRIHDWAPHTPAQAQIIEILSVIGGVVTICGSIFFIFFFNAELTIIPAQVLEVNVTGHPFSDERMSDEFIYVEYAMSGNQYTSLLFNPGFRHRVRVGDYIEIYVDTSDHNRIMRQHDRAIQRIGQYVAGGFLLLLGLFGFIAGVYLFAKRRRGI